jgi:hypothetical protein
MFMAGFDGGGMPAEGAGGAGFPLLGAGGAAFPWGTALESMPCKACLISFATLNRKCQRYKITEVLKRYHSRVFHRIYWASNSCCRSIKSDKR